MNVSIGDKFQWNRRGATLKVVGIKDDKIKFEVNSAITISGSMPQNEFENQFKGKRVR